MQDCVQAPVSQAPHKVLGCHLSNDTFKLDVREPNRFPCGVHSPCDPANVASAPERLVTSQLGHHPFHRLVAKCHGTTTCSHQGALVHFVDFKFSCLQRNTMF